MDIRWRCVLNITVWPLYPQRRRPSTHWAGGCVDPGASQKVSWEEKISSVPRFEPRTARTYVYACQHSYSLQRNEIVINQGVMFYKQSPSQKPYSFTSEHFRTISTALISYFVTLVTLELLETTKLQSWMSYTSLWAWSQAKFRKNLKFGSVFIIRGYKPLFVKE